MTEEDGYQPDQKDLKVLEETIGLAIKDPGTWRHVLLEHVLEMVQRAYRAGDEDARGSRDESDTYEGLFR